MHICVLAACVQRKDTTDVTDTAFFLIKIRSNIEIRNHLCTSLSCWENRGVAQGDLWILAKTYISREPLNLERSRDLEYLGVPGHFRGMNECDETCK